LALPRGATGAAGEQQGPTCIVEQQRVVGGAWHQTCVVQQAAEDAQRCQHPSLVVAEEVCNRQVSLHARAAPHTAGVRRVCPTICKPRGRARNNTNSTKGGVQSGFMVDGGEGDASSGGLWGGLLGGSIARTRQRQWGPRSLQRSLFGRQSVGRPRCPYCTVQRPLWARTEACCDPCPCPCPCACPCPCPGAAAALGPFPVSLLGLGLTTVSLRLRCSACACVARQKPPPKAPYLDAL